MPNWCVNTLTIRGSEEDLLSFKKKLEDSKGKDKTVCLFKTFVPIPQELENTTSPNRDEEQAEYLTEKYGFRDWYDWQHANWGIKWGCADARWSNEKPIESRNNGLFDLVLHYETPWAPGSDCLKGIFILNNNLSFFLEYEEEGMGFRGNLFVRNGEVELEEYTEYIQNDIDGVW